MSKNGRFKNMIYGFSDRDKSKVPINIQYDGDSVSVIKSDGSESYLTFIKDVHSSKTSDISLSTGYNNTHISLHSADPEEIIYTHMSVEFVGGDTGGYAYVVGFSPTYDANYKIDGADLLIYSSKSQTINVNYYYFEIGKYGI